MKILNLFGGPGTGKSTTASDLFAAMKWRNYNVELVNEFAKEATWEEHHSILQDQVYVVAMQNRKLWRIKDKVDWAVTDSPLLLALAYTRDDYLPNHFRNFVRELWDSYENINIFLNRKKPYHKIGRSQTEEEARGLDDRTRIMLDEFKIPYEVVDADENAKWEIIESIVKEHS